MKIHAIADARGRLLFLTVTDGAAGDCPIAQRLLSRTKPAKQQLGDKAYDSGELPEWLRGRGTKVVIPNRSNRKQPFKFSKKAYRRRHRIENAFCRLKDFRCIFTATTDWAETSLPPSSWRLPSSGGFYESEP